MTGGAVVLRRTVEVHRALARGDIQNAIGGAIALGYHVAEGRATQDIDVNVSLPKEDARQALEALPDDVPWDDSHRDAILRDGQVRIMWPVDNEPPMPLDLFFAEHEFHEVVAGRVIWVRLLGAEVPILSATDLVVFKALFDRTKDWADIEEVVKHSPPSFVMDEAVRWIGEIVGEDDSRIARLRALGTGEVKPPFRWP